MLSNFISGKAADIGSVFPRSPRRYFDKKSGQLEISRCSTPEGEQMAGKVKSRPGSAKTKAEEPSVVYNSAVPGRSYFVLEYLRHFEIHHFETVFLFSCPFLHAIKSFMNSSVSMLF